MPWERTKREDFALLFVIRTIFLGFVQKKGWLGDNPHFLQDFWGNDEKGYLAWKARTGETEDRFYRDWLTPLFFEALNAPPGRKVAYGHAPFSEATQRALQMAPYLNGELFKRKRGVDDEGLWIPDAPIGDFFDFLFQYNFTVEENELYDEELEVNPEFLGIIFERITNRDQGAVYTPRVEVDLICRLALVKWLEHTTGIGRADLTHLFFREAGTGEAFDEYQKQGDFSPAEIRTLIERLEHVTVCDPAAGSGAFEVGMLQVLDQTLENLYSRNNTPADLRAKAPTPFERKQAIIARSLYGVEVKRWAVWINQLRLWLTLFVEMTDDDRASLHPLLPNLTFKVRTGDSLVQRLGETTFPIHGYLALPSDVKHRITALKKMKRDFFYNRRGRISAEAIEHEEIRLFRAILDAQIEERRKAIAKLRRPPQGELFREMEPTAKAKAEEAARKRKIARLEAEIARLQAQKEALKEERPFIWSLEFAEIFFDRGGFDIVIGNPPYVRKESIADPYGKLSPQAYKAALMEMVRLDFPDYFAKSKAQTDRFRKGRKPSGRSDLYTYFYVRSLRLLNEEGMHAFICSNAWLDVGYGAWMQEFFLRKAPLHLVIDNHARRSFARADINTVITVASAPLRRGEVPRDHIVRFVAFKRPFEEAILSEYLLAIEAATSMRREEVFRVFPITVGELLREGGTGREEALSSYVGDKWGGKYLRAPDLAHRLFTAKEKIVRLREVAQILGYVHDNNLGGNYPPVPFIKSIRDTRKILITPNMVTTHGINPRGNSLVRADLLFPRTFDDVHIILWNKDRQVVGKEFYRIITEKIQPRILALLLNSTIAILQRELLGLRNLGGGAIKFSGDDVGLFTIPARVDETQFQTPILDQFLTRDIQSIFTECGLDPESEVPLAEQEPHPLPDRQALDAIVFDALGLTEDERKEVYRAVCRLVWERISKAKSV